MILPIVAYGDPVLRAETQEITKDYPDLDRLIDNMFETMYAANGIGLAAPQVGLDIRMFIVDLDSVAQDAEEVEDPEERERLLQYKGFKKVFINPIILEETGEEWPFEEGCLSIPNIREEVKRQDTIRIEYEDENFNLVEAQFDDMAARVIQHEYDHIEGVLFTDKLNPLKRRLLTRRLANISKGNVKVDYKMRFPQRKGR
ncbi:MAG: peptide deformylase [Salibacteraceae bacterium]